MSIEEGSVTVWKVGSSLSGFFNVGGPPRQGGEKGEPFKRIEFKRADDRKFRDCPRKPILMQDSQVLLIQLRH